ncbi:MAG: hypothetical protein J6I68_11535 [Butyrivibrio sp.]|uniref:hypothetical protein n=1 Tax=Butyrivibrio sp. TaxID=28121 RepID=UPI001B3D4818|nr:hypothetical protein [Butyrivibrio sp.]MBP3783868.1 hypothetical protein [Butyrivibrio sp.]
MANNTDTENSKVKGPGRPAVEDGRTVTKCFRLTKETALKLDKLMQYYGKREGKEALSIGKTLEILINDDYIRAVINSSRDEFMDDLEEAKTQMGGEVPDSVILTQMGSAVPDSVVLREKPKKKKKKTTHVDPYETGSYESFPNSNLFEKYND